MTTDRFDVVHKGNGTTFTRQARSTAVTREEHGTLARYTTWGCRCSRCRTARRRYDRAWYAARQIITTGTARRRVDSARAVQAVDILRARGWSVQDIADGADCSPSTIWRIARGEGRVWSDIADRLAELAQ